MAEPPEPRIVHLDEALTDIGAYEHQFPVAVPTLVACARVPQTKIVKAKIRKRSAKFRFKATGAAAPVRFECRLDKRRWSACKSPRTLKRLKPGRHVFRVRAVSGQFTDRTPAKRKFRVRVSAPRVS